MSEQAFEAGLRKALEAAKRPQEPPRRRATQVTRGPSMIVIYKARRAPLAQDEQHEVRVPSVLRTVGRLAAENDARKRGLRLGHIVDFRMEDAS